MAWDEWRPARPAPRSAASGYEHLAKIGDHAFGLHNRLWREGRVAEVTTDSAASDLSAQGFELGGALSHVSVKWDSALADLMDACAHISNHMDYTKNAHAGDEKDAEFNDAITKAGELGESLVGIGVGAATASAVGPGAVIAGGAAETVAGEIIGSLTEGLMKDSSGEVIYRNGEEINATRESTFALVEKAAQESEKKTGVSYPSVVSSIAGQTEAGFTSAHTNIRDYCEGVGVPNALEKDK